MRLTVRAASDEWRGGSDSWSDYSSQYTGSGTAVHGHAHGRLYRAAGAACEVCGDHTSVRLVTRLTTGEIPTATRKHVYFECLCASALN